MANKQVDYEINFKSTASLQKTYDIIKKMNNYVKKNEASMIIVTENLKAQASLINAQVRAQQQLNTQKNKQAQIDKKIADAQMQTLGALKASGVRTRIFNGIGIAGSFLSGFRASIDPTVNGNLGGVIGAYKDGIFKTIKGVYKRKENAEISKLDPNDPKFEDDVKKIQKRYEESDFKVEQIDSIVSLIKEAIQLIYEGAMFSRRTWSQVLGININIKSVWQDILSETSKSLNNMQTADASTSLFSNSKMRAQQLQLGLSGSQNYALTQTMDLLGMSSMEDIFYMNESQRAYFTTYMNKFSSLYDELNNSGTLQATQELKLAFALFKTEFSNKLLNWVSENKDKIMNLMDITLNVMSKMLDFFSWFAKWSVTGGSSTGTVSNYVNINQSTNIEGSNSEIETAVSENMSAFANEVKLQLLG